MHPDMNHAHHVHRLAEEAGGSEPAGEVRWVNVEAAARSLGLATQVLLDAIAARSLPAVTSHPRRPGAWMVRTVDLAVWARDRHDA